jgi:DNA-binding transcriptional ArsR family regulator
MEMETAIRRLSALAQDSRLQIFRLLVQAGPNGLAAGEIAKALAIPANTLSVHLNILANSDLVISRRDGRSRIYATKYDAMRELLAYLIEDCCQGKPEMCAPLLELGGICSAPNKDCC